MNKGLTFLSRDMCSSIFVVVVVQQQLYDRGVKFGLANANPRVEGVMVSAPPVIAYEYNHQIPEGSNEAELVEILKQPRDWV